MPSVRPVKILLAAVILAAGGAMRMPVEREFSAELLSSHLAEEPLKLSLREQLGQSVFIAVLGGFRSLVASVVELENLTAWQQGNWEKVEAAYKLCCQLQPRAYHYWDFQAEANFPEAYEDFAYRDRVRSDVDPWLKQKYVDRSMAVRKEALRYLPEEPRLMWKLATTAEDFRRNRRASYTEAAGWYKRAFEAAPHRRFYWRSYVYCIARSPGHELEAWPLLLDMYNSGTATDKDRTPTGTVLLYRLFPVIKAMKPDAALPPGAAEEAIKLLQDMELRRPKRNPAPASASAPGPAPVQK